MSPGCCCCCFVHERLKQRESLGAMFVQSSRNPQRSVSRLMDKQTKTTRFTGDKHSVGLRHEVINTPRPSRLLRASPTFGHAVAVSSVSCSRSCCCSGHGSSHSCRAPRRRLPPTAFPSRLGPAYGAFGPSTAPTGPASPGTDCVRG